MDSITSHFKFRTYDPEGIIFYGDTKDGQDWFVLSLRDGIPEVQIGKANMLISVKAGRKLNDGVWHKVRDYHLLFLMTIAAEHFILNIFYFLTLT